MANSRPMLKKFPHLAPISGSLPINVAKPKAMASVFGKKEMVSKSWSDMYDEEFEEEEHDRQFKDRQAQNARTFSHDEIKQDEAGAESDAQFEVDVDEEEKVVLAAKSSSDVNIKPTVTEVESDQEMMDIDDDNVNDGFFFQNSSSVAKNSSAIYSPPCKRKSGSVDKWAALGARRRAYTGHSEEKAPEIWRGKRTVGMASSATTAISGFAALGVWDHKPAATGNTHKGSKDGSWIRGKDFHHTPVFSRTAVYHHRTPVKEQENVDYAAREVYRKDNLGDLEWVGGWGDSVAGLQL